MALFNNLPDRIFEPLSSKNRRLYEISLLTVYATYYSSTREAPTRDDVIGTILNILTSTPEIWVEDEDDDISETDTKKLLNSRARRICDRLTECGWFEVNKSGYRVILEFSTTALHLMKALWKINEGVHERLEGVMQTLRSILLNLKSGEQGYTAALTQCVSHLGDIRISMRGTRTKMMRIRSEVFKIRGTRERLKFLMEGYIPEVFEVDVRQISSDRHPYRLRRQTMSVIEGFLLDEGKMERLGSEFAQDHFYKELTEGSNAEKLEAQEKGREMAYKRFSEIREELSAIEDIANSIQALQAKLSTLLQTQGLARVTHGTANTEKLEQVMTSFAAFIGRQKSDEASDDLPALVADKPLHLSDVSLRTPNVRRKPKATVLEKEPEDPVSLFRQKLTAAYHERVNASDERLMAFLDGLIGHNGTFTFDESCLSTIDDFIAASAMLKLAISREIPPMIEDKYQIVCDDEFDLIETEYMTCPKVTIRRVQETRHAA